MSTQMAYNFPQWDIYHQKTCDTAFYNVPEIPDSPTVKINSRRQYNLTLIKEIRNNSPTESSHSFASTILPACC